MTSFEVTSTSDGVLLTQLNVGGSANDVDLLLTWAQANKLQEDIRNALVKSGVTMRQAVGHSDLGVVGHDEIQYAVGDGLQVNTSTHVLTEALALLLGVKPTEVHSVEPTGYLVEVRQDCGTIVNRYSRKVELP